jgi:3'-5' exoribonuclease
MKELTWLKDVLPGKPFVTVVRLKIKERKRSKVNDPYLRLVFEDKSGTLDATLWNPDLERLEEALRQGETFRLEGVGSSYLGKRCMTIKSLAKVPEDPWVKERLDILPLGRKHWLLANLKDLSLRIENAYLRKLLMIFLEDRAFMERFGHAPGGKEIHHSHEGGLLEHTVSIMGLCVKLKEHYSALSLDLLLAGAFLHDIGKVEELDPDHEGIYTDEGRLLGHITLGAMMAEKRMSKIRGFPKSLRSVVLHMILSHQGTYEFGSPKRPKFAEAIILYYLDEIDSKLFQMREFIRQQGGEDDTGPWTGYNRWLGRYLLRDAARFITDPSQEESSLAPSLDAIKREPSLFEGLSG